MDVGDNLPSGVPFFRGGKEPYPSSKQLSAEASCIFDRTNIKSGETRTWKRKVNGQFPQRDVPAEKSM